ncbi:MAG: PspA/IM30 family protein [Xanthomonadales bacterium]|nr:PspA/IM30 family protein [Xanthomonadales bacterium]
MALITRLSRLVRADMHAVLDRIEEPDVLLQQAVREMEDEVAADAQRHKAAARQREDLRTRIVEFDSALARIGEELDLCFEASNETLARTLLRRRLEGERLRKQCVQQLASLDARVDELARSLEDRRQRLEAMRQKAALFEVDASRPSAERGAWQAESAEISDADVELAWLREKQQRGGA